VAGAAGALGVEETGAAGAGATAAAGTAAEVVAATAPGAVTGGFVAVGIVALDAKVAVIDGVEATGATGIIVSAGIAASTLAGSLVVGFSAIQKPLSLC
jgi:hypothetical protein